MADSMKIGYFPHYVNARDDIGLQKLDAVYGKAVGYGHYFILLEQIYQTNSPVLDLSDRLTTEIVAKAHEWEPEELIDFVETCVKFDVFSKEMWDCYQHVTSDLLCETFNTMAAKKRAGKAGGRPRKADEKAGA